ncbi:MAG TPA: potassium transporter Kup [Alphaproteobacteria bacterium]|jgi:KUP system potassium uptake protein
MTPQPGRDTNLSRLMLGALGVVYGDIGTSPLYTIRECFSAATGIKPTLPEVLGILSLIFWSLVLVVTVKYVLFILRADNRGEGGTLALMALVAEKLGHGRRGRIALTIGMIGAALFFGDALLTPAISVLSAVEGLKVAAPVLEHWIVPLSVAILVALFAFQYRGTGRVGSLFGPVMLVWFAVLGVTGIISIVETPAVLAALDPRYAVLFFAHHGVVAFLVLGLVFLAVTGAETLYADLGHFGRRAMGLSWLVLVLPCLLLNYFGQGALILRTPEAIANPFYLIVPTWGLYPMIILATVATVIASQAVISGAYSVSRQAVLIGFMPRLTIVHTSTREMGQIYMPHINAFLFVGVLALVLGFQNSSNMAAAYGIAVTGIMVSTTLLAYLYLRHRRGWGCVPAAAVIAGFLAIDLAFLASTLIKVPEGGWVSLLVAAFVFVIMSTWVREREIAHARSEADAIPLADFAARIAEKQKAAGGNGNGTRRVPGTAVFLSQRSGIVPHALLHNLKHNHVLHERIAIVTVETEDRPWVPLAERVEFEKVGAGFYRIVAHYGFMQSPNVPAVLEQCAGREGFTAEPMMTSYFFGRDKFVARAAAGLGRWRESIFIFLQRNAISAADFFRIPTNRTVELGTQIEI